jgi:DNA-binding response OmpR family regulator
MGRLCATGRKPRLLSNAPGDDEVLAVVTLTIGRSALSPQLFSTGGGRRATASEVEPLAVVLLRRGPVSLRALGALQTDPRLELLVTDELTPEWAALAQRVTGVIVATEGDPLDALVYTLTAQVRTAIVVAFPKRFTPDCRDLMSAGAAACLTTPVTQADLDRLVPLLSERAGLARIDSTLRLLLDPIARIARYQDQVVRLSQREFALLHYLSSRRGRPVAAAELMTHVWGDAETTQPSRQILDVYVHQLRKKLEQLGLKGAITTVRMYGYALVQVTGEGGGGGNGAISGPVPARQR